MENIQQLKKKGMLKKRQMLYWERRAFLDGASLIIGVDEAGRGPLAGPVVAGAVMLRPAPLKRFIAPAYRHRIDDSKKLRPGLREKAFSEISKKTIFGIGIKDNYFIDRENIHRATFSAMRLAVKKLVNDYCKLNNKKEKDIRKDVCILVDGKIAPGFSYKTIPIIKGDSRSFSIALASIMAKVTRDRLMCGYDKKYPVYGFAKHKGYGTSVHMDAIKKHGACPIHRKTFAPLSEDITYGALDRRKAT